MSISGCNMLVRNKLKLFVSKNNDYRKIFKANIAIVGVEAIWKKLNMLRSYQNDYHYCIALKKIFNYYHYSSLSCIYLRFN